MISQKKGLEGVGKYQFKKLPEYKAGRSENYLGRRLSFIPFGYPIYINRPYYYYNSGEDDLDVYGLGNDFH